MVWLKNCKCAAKSLQLVMFFLLWADLFTWFVRSVIFFFKRRAPVLLKVACNVQSGMSVFLRFRHLYSNPKIARYVNWTWSCLRSLSASEIPSYNHIAQIHPNLEAAIHGFCRCVLAQTAYMLGCTMCLQLYLWAIGHGMPWALTGIWQHPYSQYIWQRLRIENGERNRNKHDVT